MAVPDLDPARVLRRGARAADGARRGLDARRRERLASRHDDLDPRPLGFVHVPKSAGVSAIASLKAALPEHRWAPWVFDESMLGPFRGVPVTGELAARVLPSAVALADYDAAAGHFPVPTFRSRFDPIDLALVVREPRSRLLSHYEFWRHWDDDLHDAHLPWTSSRSAVRLDFDVWLSEPSIAHQTDNLLTRQLLGDDPAVPPDDFIAPAAMSSVARRAVRVLRSIGWVGLVEQGDEMWRSLGRRVGAELRPERENPTRHRPDLPTDLGAVMSARATRALAARTAADTVVWHEVAVRVGMASPAVEADVAWTARLDAAVRARRSSGPSGPSG